MLSNHEIHDCRAYRNLVMELIFLCRFLVQAHEQSLNYSIRLKKLLIAADDALKSTDEAGNKTSKRVNKEVLEKFRNAITLLSGLEEEFFFTDHRMVTREAKNKPNSPLTTLFSLKDNSHAKPMDSEWLEDPEPTRVVEFHLLNSLPDAHPVVVKLVLSNSPSLQEILWKFSRLKNKKKRLTLKDNPHFYVGLPTLPEAYKNSIEINPTEDFRHANKFYVLTDKPELVHIVTDQDAQFFSNFWCSQSAIIFKDVCGRLRGGSTVKASLKGTCCGFCKRLLPVPTDPGTSRGHRRLLPIITHWDPSMAGECLISCHPMHSSVDFGLCIFSGRVEPASAFLVPLPPRSERPQYSVAYKTHIHMLDNDSLLQIFSCYRLEDENNWNHRHTWRILTHVCRRWRHLMSDSWSHLDMCLVLTNDSTSLDTLSHLRLLPLVIDYSDRTGVVARKDEDNIHFGLQQHGRVRRVVIRAPSSSLCVWLELMNNVFPRLEDLSFSSMTTKEMSPVLPETLQAPDLRRLSLHGIGLSRGLPILSSTIALSILSLTHIGESCYFPPGHLVTQLQGLPHLEELSIGFAIPIPLPSREGELLPAPIPAVTLPTLRRLTFRGVGVYLDNLVAQINTPLLEQLNLTLFFEIAFSLVNLAEFIHRTEGFECLVARVVFNTAGPFIDTDQQGPGKLSLRINCEPLDWQVDSAAQVCSALGMVLYSVEDLTIDLNVDGMPSNWKNTLDNMLWHELLLPFIGVKKFRIGSSLTFELSQALEPVAEGLVPELLPELQELDVQLEMDQTRNAFSVFIETRESVGRPLRLLVPPRYIPRATTKWPYVDRGDDELFRWFTAIDSQPVDVAWDVELHSQLEHIFRPMSASPATSLTVKRGNGDEAPPKKEHRRGHGGHENKRRLRENPQRRANENWRYRQPRGAPRINTRISQPGGKITI